ncbi:MULTISPECIES: hypothetical protein [Bradyrhizobium]|jgi:hypothetical protein|uniref:DUF680 domain-containing protein n=2 Tax=Bradyrhizobium TaxID=374 RepID=A0ABY0PXG8_9BRAD|nr:MULTISPECIES: hypothetical protein [Bradyrhizobium]SDJ11198.1 hypothetical protein SAMN05444163_4579 [Bradyrhizobium ottawaense]SEC92311.1 hypothetical protein SAMN05444171_2583 [Bradyrhizobium lablabi]SHK99796.1 hypothetical protein SAMN05444321_1407 [Bradyrhizobium lablabi]
MRKLILISAFALASVSASVSARAGDRSLILAANDAPAATTTAPAEAKPEVTTDTAKPEATKKQASKPQKTHARHTYEGDEAKARRIAARYGVYW